MLHLREFVAQYAADLLRVARRRHSGCQQDSDHCFRGQLHLQAVAMKLSLLQPRFAEDQTA